MVEGEDEGSEESDSKSNNEDEDSASEDATGIEVAESETSPLLGDEVSHVGRVCSGVASGVARVQTEGYVVASSGIKEVTDHTHLRSEVAGQSGLAF
ncbi:hypothetical protein U1Q18_039421 [Sarracenia purpurea var. burkii]